MVLDLSDIIYSECKIIKVHDLLSECRITIETLERVLSQSCEFYRIEKKKKGTI